MPSASEKISKETEGNMSYYHTFGPFTVPRKDGAGRNKVLDGSRKAINSFWANIEQSLPGLSTACGCYIFGVRAGKGVTPWYVGQSKTGFKNECFATTKINHYHDVINDISKGTPVLIILARYTQEDNMARTVRQDEVDFVEQYMIGLALGKNPDLRNVKNTKFSRTLQIPGVLNNPPGQPNAGARLLRQTLGV